MDHHLASLPIETYHSSLKRDSLISLADMHLFQALSLKFHSLTPSHTSFLETLAGISTLVLLRVLEESRHPKRSAFSKVWQRYAQILRAAIHSVVTEDEDLRSAGSTSDDGSEVLYGRAGLLYALLLLRASYNRSSSPSLAGQSEPTIFQEISTLTSDANIQTIVNSLMLRGKVGSLRYANEVREGPLPAFMWSWHGKRYMGAAHGVGGSSYIYSRNSSNA
jgi:hypothetical protein